MPPPTASAAARPADNAQFLRKQRTAVEAIAADNAKLKEELVLENKFSVNPTTQTAAALIGNLQAQADVYAAKVCVRGGGLGGGEEDGLGGVLPHPTLHPRLLRSPRSSGCGRSWSDASRRCAAASPTSGWRWAA